MTNQQKQHQDIAIFDLDHTITRKDTYLSFLILFLKTHPFRLLHCWFLPFAVAIHKFKIRDNTWLKETFLTAIVSGTSRQELDKFIDIFIAKTVENDLYKDALTKIEYHQVHGDHLVLASASFDFYVNKLAAYLGFEKTLCTLAKWDDDSLTGKISGKNCYAVNKQLIVENYLRSINNKGHITIYSDHHSDLAIFALADKPVAVNPTDKLRSTATLAGMTIVKWS